MKFSLSTIAVMACLVTVPLATSSFQPPTLMRTKLAWLVSRPMSTTEVDATVEVAVSTASATKPVAAQASTVVEVVSSMPELSLDDQVVDNVGLQPSGKVAPQMGSRDPIKAELAQRALLIAQLQQKRGGAAGVTEDGPAVVASQRPRKITPDLPFRDAIKAEQAQRALLTARLEMQRSVMVPTDGPAVGPQRPRKDLVELPPRDAVKNEQVQRALLAARLEMAVRVGAVAAIEEVVPAVGPQRPRKMAAELASRDITKQEQTQRSLLAATLEMAALARAAAAVDEVVPAVGPQRPRKVKVELPPRDPVKGEQTQRAILADRIQRGLAAAEAAAAANSTGRRQQPLCPVTEAELAAKYAAIDCLSERAFTILKDIGALEIHEEDEAEDWWARIEGS